MQYRLVTLMLAVVLALGLAACGGDDDNGSSDNSDTECTSGIAADAGGTLSIKDFAFSPITVASGAKVTVRNDDGFAHTVTADNGEFDCSDVEGGSTVNFTAPSEPGSYPFHCNIHGSMKGTLTVR